MQNTLQIECFVQALSEYMDAKIERDKAYMQFTEGGGYSWGYFGQREEDAVAKAAAKLEDSLLAVINKAIGKETV